MLTPRDPSYFPASILEEAAASHPGSNSKVRFEETHLSIRFRFEADFADIFEVRGTKRERKGQFLDDRFVAIARSLNIWDSMACSVALVLSSRRNQSLSQSEKSPSNFICDPARRKSLHVIEFASAIRRPTVHAERKNPFQIDPTPIHRLARLPNHHI